MSYKDFTLRKIQERFGLDLIERPGIFADVEGRAVSQSLRDILLENVPLATAIYRVITRRHADDAVVMSLAHFNSLMETVHLLRSPANAAHLARFIAQYQAGEVQTGWSMRSMTDT